MSEITKYRELLNPYFQGDDQVILDNLLKYADNLYDSLYRYSGESYFDRALRLTCDKILKLNPDQATIIASVLINATYSPKCDLNEIQKLFGDEVKYLVESLDKIDSIKSRYSESDTKVIGNMFLTLAEDLRVIIIRLADRIENMETLEFKSVEKQKANAREILDVYVPIASRLGLYEFKLILQDLAFKYVYPEDYKNLKNEMDEYLSHTQKTIDDMKHELENLMFRSGFDVKVSGRVKNLFSIFNKLKKKTATLDDLYDVFALRIVLNTDENIEEDKAESIEALYKILSLLNARYTNLPDRFKDYIANPKPNGYRSLHIAVIGLNSKNSQKPTEIQIRTASMHKFAEQGFAAHWLYKENKSAENNENLMKVLNDLRENLSSIDHSVSELKMNLYPNKVFVLTPNNLVKELPIKSTPVDFAFAVHSDIGMHCQLAKVNGHVVPLDYQLKNGDIVEVLTSNNVTVKLNWLETVKTKLAKSKIKNYFKTLDSDVLLQKGRDELNLLLSKLQMPKLDDNLSFLKTYKGKSMGLKDREAVLEELGGGTISVNTVFKNAYGISIDSLMKKEKNAKHISFKKVLIPKTDLDKPVNLNNSRLIIGGELNMPYRLSNCCKPKLSDNIVGYITKVKGVSIHKINCVFVRTANKNRLLEARLEYKAIDRNLSNYLVSLFLEIDHRTEYLKSVIEYFNRENITIQSFDMVEDKDQKPQRKVVVGVNNEKELDKIINNLNLIDGVTVISKM